MVHEGMLLEYSGRPLGVLHLGDPGQAAGGARADGGALPALGAGRRRRRSPAAGRLAGYVAQAGALGLALALVETVIAKLRIFRLPDLLGRGQRSAGSRWSRAPSFGG